MTSQPIGPLPPVAAEGPIVVFGATGGVGRHAVRQLLGAGEEVIAGVRDPAKGTPLAKAGARFVSHDLQHDNPEQLASHLNDAESALFAGGAGYGESFDELDAVDRGGVVAAVAAGTSTRTIGYEQGENEMNVSLDTMPAPVRDYFTAMNALDSVGMVAPFTSDGLVNDIQREFWGPEAIKRWADRESIGDRVVWTAFTDAKAHHGDYIVGGAACHPLPVAPPPPPSLSTGRARSWLRGRRAPTVEDPNVAWCRKVQRTTPR